MGGRRDVWVGGGMCGWEEGCVEGRNGCVGRVGMSEGGGMCKRGEGIQSENLNVKVNMKMGATYWRGWDV